MPFSLADAIVQILVINLSKSHVVGPNPCEPTSMMEEQVTARLLRQMSAHWMLGGIALHNVPLFGELADRKGRKMPQSIPICLLHSEAVP